MTFLDTGCKMVALEIRAIAEVKVMRIFYTFLMRIGKS